MTARLLDRVFSHYGRGERNTMPSFKRADKGEYIGSEESNTYQRLSAGRLRGSHGCSETCLFAVLTVSITDGVVST
jgi:hypothetical protein